MSDTKVSLELRIRALIDLYDGQVNYTRSDEVWLTLGAQFPAYTDREGFLDELRGIKAVSWDRAEHIMVTVDIQL
jgi:hypothetical protein